LREGNLFNSGSPEKAGGNLSDSPLADRMRPTSFDNLLGQDHLFGRGGPFRKLVEDDNFGSLIIWGPPGSGKTTVARIISTVTGRAFIPLSAVESGVKELKEAVKTARFNLGSGEKTILFIDEIHRYSKIQQDALLPHVETGLLTLIGATTENPSFGVIPALRSRCSVIELKPLDEKSLAALLKRAVTDEERGLRKPAPSISEKVLERIALFAGGDARVALSLLEACAEVAGEGAIEPGLVENISRKSFLLYDRAGQSHYDHASAFQKSLRGSDPDAAVYWMARMLEAGEDPRFIARRLIVTAAEDVGNADPTALILAVSAAEAVEKIGLPEGRIPLAQAVLYVACAPKSNSAVRAVDEAVSHIRQTGSLPQVPLHLRDKAYKKAAGLGKEGEYRNPHRYPGRWVEQDYLPSSLKGKFFYTPSEYGREATLNERLKKLRERKK
jgi:putative ATPase